MNSDQMIDRVDNFLEKRIESAMRLSDKIHNLNDRRDVRKFANRKFSTIEDITSRMSIFNK